MEGLPIDVDRVGVVQGSEIALDAAHAGLEPFLLCFDQVGVEDAENRGKLLECDVGVGLQGRQVAVGAEFVFREVHGVGGDKALNVAPAGENVEELVVRGGGEGLLELGPQLDHVLQERVGLLVEVEGPAHVGPDGLDVILESVRISADSLGAHRVGFLEVLQAALDAVSGGKDLRPDLGDLFLVGGGGEARCGGDKGAAVLGDTEGGLDLGHTALVDFGLGFVDPLEAEPADETGGHGEGNGNAEGGEELGRDAETEGDQAFQRVHFRQRPARVNDENGRGPSVQGVLQGLDGPVAAVGADDR